MSRGVWLKRFLKNENPPYILSGNTANQAQKTARNTKNTFAIFMKIPRLCDWVLVARSIFVLCCKTVKKIPRHKLRKKHLAVWIEKGGRSRLSCLYTFTITITINQLVMKTLKQFQATLFSQHPAWVGKWDAKMLIDGKLNSICVIWNVI